MIKLVDLQKSFGDIDAVNQISLQINRGEIFGFIGNNGAGKTTTIKMMIGLLKPDNGQIIIDGIDVEQNPLKVKKRAGYAPEEPVLYEYLSGYEFLDFIADVKGLNSKQRKDQIEELIEFFALTEKQNQMIKTYSHGMRKKVALAAAFIARPKILLLDEPITGLDPECSYRTKQRLTHLSKEGVTIFFSSHILEAVEKICHRIGIIHEGRLILSGTMKELRLQFHNASSLEEIFVQLTEKSKGKY